jgi:hypothetical protein
MHNATITPTDNGPYLIQAVSKTDNSANATMTARRSSSAGRARVL